MENLKPCPFCGEPAKTEVRVTGMGGGTDTIDFSIVCPKCGTSKTVRLKIAKTCFFLDVDRAMMEVQEAWNRRADHGTD